MAARAIWKGVIGFAHKDYNDLHVPVKLFSAAQDKTVHFNLFHKKDRSPIKQRMINPDTNEIIPHEETLRAYRTEEGDLVKFTQEELEALQPEKSRDIQIVNFVPTLSIEHHWFERPYFLAPDGEIGPYQALTRALADSQLVGIVHWVMRNKEYIGALQLFQGYPLLVSLRNKEQIVDIQQLDAPQGKPLDKKELAMARQLISMLVADYNPEEFEDDYRRRVLELIDVKQHGGKVKTLRPRKSERSEDVTKALQASLKSVKYG